MKYLLDINVGLDKIAKFFLEKNLDKSSDKFVYESIGILKSIPLHWYNLKDGTIAEEYPQFVTENEFGQSIVFLGLKTQKKRFEWSGEKIINKLEKTFNIET